MPALGILGSAVVGYGTRALANHVVIPAVTAGAKAIANAFKTTDPSARSAAGLQQMRQTGTAARSTPFLNMVYGMSKNRVSKDDLGGANTITGNLLSDKKVAEARLVQRPDRKLKPEPMPTPAATLRNDPPLRVRPHM